MLIAFAVSAAPLKRQRKNEKSFDYQVEVVNTERKERKQCKKGEKKRDNRLIKTIKEQKSEKQKTQIYWEGNKNFKCLKIKNCIDKKYQLDINREGEK